MKRREDIHLNHSDAVWGKALDPNPSSPKIITGLLVQAPQYDGYVLANKLWDTLDTALIQSLL